MQGDLAGRPLSSQEDQTLVLLCSEGLTMGEIAARLFCHRNTVKWRIERIKAKFGIRSTAPLTELIAYGWQHGLVVADTTQIQTFIDYVNQKLLKPPSFNRHIAEWLQQQVELYASEHQAI